MSDGSALASVLWGLAGELGKVMDPRAVGEFALALLVLKHASEAGRKRAKGSTQSLVVPSSASFNAILINADKPENARRLETALSELERANRPALDGLAAILKASSETVRSADGLNAVLSNAIKIVAAAPPLSDLEKEQDGLTSKALDYLSREFFAKAHMRPGEIYTPKAIVRVMMELTQPQPGQSVYDPACGTGSMLIAAAEYLKQHDRKGQNEVRLVGQEMGAIPARLARMNLFMHGVDPERIAHGDTLHNPLLENGTLSKFDVVVGNPPFSLADWGWEVLKDDRFGRFKYGVPPKGRADYAFILHMIESMKPKTGRMAVIVPHGALFRGGSEGDIRKNLIKSNLLEAVIGLPPKLFYNTAIPTAVLFFRHGRATDSVMFVDASHDFEVGRKLNSLREKDVVQVVETCQKRIAIPSYSRLVSVEEIAANDFNLNIPLYVTQEDSEAPTVSAAVLAAREKVLSAELADIQREIALRLGEIGLRSRT